MADWTAHEASLQRPDSGIKWPQLKSSKAVMNRKLEFDPWSLTKKQLRRRIQENERRALTFENCWYSNPSMAAEFHGFADAYRRELQSRPNPEEDD